MSRADRYLIDSFAMPGDMVCETFSTGMSHVLVKAENCSLLGSKTNSGREDSADTDYVHLFNISSPFDQMREMTITLFTAAANRLLVRDGGRLVTPEQAPHVSKERLSLSIPSQTKVGKIYAVMRGYDGPDENRWVVLASMLAEPWVFNEFVTVDSIIARASLIDYDDPNFTIFSTFSLFSPNFPDVKYHQGWQLGYSGDQFGLLIGLYRAFAVDGLLQPYGDLTLADLPHHASISANSIDSVRAVAVKLKSRAWNTHSLGIDLTGANCHQIDFIRFVLDLGTMPQSFVSTVIELTRNTEGNLMDRIDPKLLTTNFWTGSTDRIEAVVNALVTDPDQKAIYYRSIESSNSHRNTNGFAQVAMVAALVNNPDGMKEANTYLSHEDTGFFVSTSRRDAVIDYLVSGSDLPIEWWVNLNGGA